MTAYMPILESAVGEPAAYRFASSYDSAIAQVCLKSAAKIRNIGDFNVIRTGRILVVWRGESGLREWPFRIIAIEK